MQADSIFIVGITRFIIRFVIRISSEVDDFGFIVFIFWAIVVLSSLDIVSLSSLAIISDHRGEDRRWALSDEAKAEDTAPLTEAFLTDRDTCLITG